MIAKQIPNILTLFRLVLIPPFLLYLFQKQYDLAFIIFVVAGVTDALDGWLARHYHCQTPLGSFMDPLADKLLAASSFISLAWIGSLPWWLVVLVFLRDLTIAIGVVLWFAFIKNRIEFRPTLLSKINTMLQSVLVTVCLIQLAFFKFPLYIFQALVMATACTTAFSYVDYVWTWGRKACTINHSSS